MGTTGTDREPPSQRWLFACAVLLAAIPLLWPVTPPLVDVPGHIGRFRVQIDLGSTPGLQHFFSFQWRLIGNLGTDLLIIPLARIFGLELGVKLIVLSIPVLTVAGLFAVAREVHGKVPPTILFAVPFAYGYPFNFGFINFCLSISLALLAFACWLRLTRDSRLRLRAAIFVPISCLLWLTHAFGWGVLGLLAWSSELVRLRDQGKSWFRGAISAGIECLPLCVPVILMVFWRSGDVGGRTNGYFGIASKTFSLAAALRDRWLLWDSFSVGVVLVLIGSAIWDRHLELSRKLAIPAAVLFMIFTLLPAELFGSAYADMRLAPFMLMIAIAAIRLRPNADVSLYWRMIVLGFAFMGARLAGNTLSYLIADREFESATTALNYMPRNARVLSLVGDACGLEWAMPRYSHLGSFVITRKGGFSNDQWQLPGAQLLTVTYPPAGDFSADPSEVTFSTACQRKTLATLPIGWRVGRTADQALQDFPREAFDFVWLVHPSGFTNRPPDGLALVWRGPDSALYRVVADPRRPADGRPRYSQEGARP